MKKGKSTDALMRHIRECHNINVGGSPQKQALLNMGYYHGYKAVRYVKEERAKLDLSDFTEIAAIYNFDSSVKTLMYPILTKLETAIKNRIIDYLVSSKISNIDDIYHDVLVGYKEYDEPKKYNKRLSDRLMFRNKMDETIAYHFKKGTPTIAYYLHRGKPIPVWGFFEVMTLGELANFVDCMAFKDRINIARLFEIQHTGMNDNGRLMGNTLLTLVGLRNATMHNSMVFDCRFDNINTSKQVKAFFSTKTGIKNIDYSHIVDFLISCIVILKSIHTSKTDLKRIVRDFDKECTKLFSSIPFSAYSSIMGTDVKRKIDKMNDYIKV